MPTKCSRASSNEFVPKDIDPIHSMSHISARDCVSCSVLKLPLNMCRFWIALCSILASLFRYLYYRVFSYLSTILDLYWKIWLHTLAVVEKSIKKDIMFSSKGNIKIVWGGKSIIIVAVIEFSFRNVLLCAKFLLFIPGYICSLIDKIAQQQFYAAYTAPTPFSFVDYFVLFRESRIMVCK